jgi:hypothetical protein
VSLIGFVCLAAAVAAWILRPALLPAVLAVAALLPDTAAVRFGENAVSCCSVVAVVVAARLGWLLTRPRVRQRLREALRPVDRVLLAALAGYAVLITALGPAVFAGTPVTSPRNGLDLAGGGAVPLAYSVSNAAQLVYLLLGLAVAVYLVAEPRTDARILGLTFGGAAVLAVLSWALGPSWPHGVLDTMPFSYVNGQGRVRGTFAEPSILGVALAGGIAWFGARALRFRGATRWRAVAALAVSVVAAVLNRSGTLLVALGGIALLAVVVLVVRMLRRRPAARPAVLAGLAVVAAAAVLALTPPGAAVVDVLTGGKLHTESFSHRSSADLAALRVLTDTAGLGAGLGSDRASGLLTTELACLGVIGTLALFGLIARAAVGGLRRDLLAAPAWALVAVTIAQITAVPDASLPFLWLALGTTLAVRAARAAPRRGTRAARRAPSRVPE